MPFPVINGAEIRHTGNKIEGATGEAPQAELWNQVSLGVSKEGSLESRFFNVFVLEFSWAGTACYLCHSLLNKEVKHRF